MARSIRGVVTEMRQAVAPCSVGASRVLHGFASSSVALRKISTFLVAQRLFEGGMIVCDSC